MTSTPSSWTGLLWRFVHDMTPSIGHACNRIARSPISIVKNISCPELVQGSKPGGGRVCVRYGWEDW